MSVTIITREPSIRTLEVKKARCREDSVVMNTRLEIGISIVYLPSSLSGVKGVILSERVLSRPARRDPPLTTPSRPKMSSEIVRILSVEKEVTSGKS